MFTWLTIQIQYLAICHLLSRFLVKSSNGIWSFVRFEYFFGLWLLRGEVGGDLAEFNKISFSCNNFRSTLCRTKFKVLSLVLTNSLFLRVKSCNRWIQASEPLMDRIGSTRDRRALSLEQSAHNPLLSPQDLQTRSPLVWGGRQVGALPGRGSGWSPTAEDLLQEEAGPFQERGVGAVAWGKAFCCKPVQGTNWVSAERAASRHCGAIGESWWVSSTGRFPPLDPDTGRHSKHGANLLF